MYSGHEDVALPEGDLLLELGHVAISLGLVEEAAAIMDGLIVLQPERPHPRIGKALALHVGGKRDAAMEELQGVISSFPNAVFARSMLARFLKQAGRTDEAHSVAQEVLELDAPDFVREIALEVLDHVLPARDAGSEMPPRSSFTEAGRSKVKQEVFDSGNGPVKSEGTQTSLPLGFRGRPV